MVIMSKFVSMSAVKTILVCILQEADAKIDWWSKFYASIGDLEKAGTYLEQGYETMTVKKLSIKTSYIFISP